MKYSFIKKMLVLSAILLDQSAFAMAPTEPSAVDKQALMDRINQLTLNANGAISDQELIGDIGDFAEEYVDARTLLQIISSANVSYSVARTIVADEEKRSEFLLKLGLQGQAARALLMAALKKIVELKKQRQMAAPSNGHT